jgi:hypothetical protein
MENVVEVGAEGLDIPWKLNSTKRGTSPMVGVGTDVANAAAAGGVLVSAIWAANVRMVAQAPARGISYNPWSARE